ncbi:MAG: hypothetical protein J6W81_08750 [Lentisphaeria bacterium]|nr:hypothetical protein [Lentisphaeria bacterium]
MKNWVSNILTVQQYDMKLRDLEIKYKTIPAEKAKLKEEFMAEQKKLLDAKEQLAQLELSNKKTEGEIAELNERIKKNLTQSALVKKNDEYQAMMNSIEDAKQKISDLETVILENMDKLEAARKHLADQERDYAAVVRQTKEELAEFEQLVVQIKADALKLKAERKGFVTRVELNVLSVYQNILSKDKGKPVVPITNGSCGHCLLKVTPQVINEAKKGTMILCDNCSHILYDPDAQE